MVCFYNIDRQLPSLVSTIALLLWFMLVSNQLFAQDDISKRVGDYEVFYSTFNTSFLRPEVASAINVVRAKDRALLNISIRKHLPDSPSVETDAHTISGTVFDLVHKKPLEFRKIEETGAIYYLAEIDISNNNEVMFIDVSVVPVAGMKPIEINLKRNFFFND